MTSVRPCRKRRHPDKERAFDHMRWLIRTNGYIGNQSLNVFWHKDCGSWHVGHKPQQQVKKAKGG